MIDIHCHILPGIDDGPATLDEALALARAMVADGITHAVATPHVFPGRYNNTRSSIQKACAEFQQALQAAQIPLQLSFAGEVRLTPEVLELLTQGELPFYNDQPGQPKHMLLEMPDGQIPVGAERFTALLLGQGICPVIAHPERNRAVMQDPQRLRPFVEQGCMVQVTAGSLTGHFGCRVQGAVRVLLDEGWVNVVASDAHNLSGRRPRMSEAAAWLTLKCGLAVSRLITYINPTNIFGNKFTQSQEAQHYTGAFAR